MNKLKVLDIFAGIGGFSLGLERTGGFETVAFCEIDKDCQKVLRKHWPHVALWSDIKKLNTDRLNTILPNSEIWQNISVITGGHPCTGHSVAGKKEGFKNEASNLWTEYLRLISEIKPKYVIIENSHNLRSTGLADVLKNLWEVGYYVEWSIISAYGVGAPHQRERIYIVAWRHDLPYCDPFRPWGTYSKKEKTKSKWWTEVGFKRCDVFKQVGNVKPTILRSDNGLSNRLHENRVKQLGNAVVPQIPQLIGEQILKSLSQ